VSSLRIILLSSVCLTLTACGQYTEDRYLVRRDTVTSSAGDAVASNSAVQIPTPWPRNSNNPNIPFDGEKSSLAVKRYREDKEFLPRELEWHKETQEIGPGTDSGAGVATGAGAAAGPPPGQGYGAGAAAGP
jgi:hypothetical protein